MENYTQFHGLIQIKLYISIDSVNDRVKHSLRGLVVYQLNLKYHNLFYVNAEIMILGFKKLNIENGLIDFNEITVKTKISYVTILCSKIKY